MCLIAVALGVSRRYPLIVAANRDERHARPTEPAAWWSDLPHVLAGRDLLAGGTWLGVDRRGRVAAVTNIRDPERRAGLRSRGSLVAGFLAGEEPARQYAARAVEQGSELAPFNLILVEADRLHYASNRAPAAELGAGLHVFGNAPPGVAWPKLATTRAAMARLLDHAEPLEPLFELLAQRHGAAEPEERYRGDHFIVGADYGTRCSTIVLRDAAGSVLFAERSFDATGQKTGEIRTTFVVDAR